MKKIVCLLCAAAFLLAGCNKKRPDELPPAQPATIKVGNTIAPAECYDYFKSQMAIDTGSTVTSETVVNDAAKQVELMTKSIAVSEAMNLPIIEEYRDFLVQIVTSYGSEEAYKTEMKMTDEIFEFYTYAFVCQLKLSEQYKLDNGITADKEDEMFKTFFLRTKNLFLSTEGKTDEEKASLKSKLDNLLLEAQGGADFDTLIAENSDDKSYVYNPDGVIFTAGEAIQEFHSAASGIEPGQFTTLETESGYHIIQRLAIDETPELYEKFKKENIQKINSFMIDPEAFKEYLNTKTEQLGLQVVYTSEQE